MTGDTAWDRSVSPAARDDADAPAFANDRATQATFTRHRAATL